MKASPEVLADLRSALAELAAWEEDTVSGAFESVMEKHDLKLGKLAQPVRVALTGGSVSPGIFETAAVLGKDRVLRRLDHAIEMVAGQDQGRRTRASSPLPAPPLVALFLIAV